LGSFCRNSFLFIFVSNWLGALVPWKLIKLPEGELAAPTNDINTTVALSLLTSISYFYGGFKAKGLRIFAQDIFHQRQFSYQLTFRRFYKASFT